MQSHVIETIIGAVVLAVASLFIAYAYRVAGTSSSSGYEVMAYFNRVDGLVLGADVRLSGIRVGTVTNMELDHENYEAVVTMAIDPEVRLYEDTAAKITSAGLFGNQYILLDPGGGGDLLEQGDEITNATGSVDLMDLISRFIFSSDGEE